MDYQKQIVEFLSKPENLPIALEVSKHIDDVHQNLQRLFWIEVTKALQNRLNTPGLGDRWELKYEEDKKKDCVYLSIEMKYLPKAFRGSYLSLVIERGPHKTNC